MIWEGDKQNGGILRVLVKIFDSLIILSCFPMVRLGIGNTSVYLYLLFEVGTGVSDTYMCMGHTRKRTCGPGL